MEEKREENKNVRGKDKGAEKREGYKGRVERKGTRAVKARSGRGRGEE